MTTAERKMLDDKNTSLLQVVNDKMFQKGHGLLCAISINPASGEVDFHTSANMTIQQVRQMLQDILYTLNQGKPIIILDKHD